MVFQNYALFPQMDVYENIAYGLRRRRLPNDEIRQRVTEALNMVRLQGIEKRRVHELSGGQQQRIALARALVTQPQALLLDEPLSNLDARLRADMRLEIRRIQRHLGITAVYVTHDQEEAMSIADRIVIMNKGKVEAIGPPQEIYDNPATRFVADFIGRCNFIDGRVEDGRLIMLGRGVDINTDLPAGSSAVCAVRPERVKLEAPGNSAVQARVKETVFLGPVVRYDLIVDGVPGLEIISEVPVSRAVFKTGDSVGIIIEPEDIRLLSS
jgi:ABC-type Fe3+/spermidine/putrescine transport system ATPase subunit